MLAAPPARRLTLAFVVALLSVLAALTLATRPPWLGVRLAAADGAGDGAASVVAVVAVDAEGPAGRAGLRAGARLLSVGGVAVAPGDLLEEPDFLDRWPLVDAFYARQGALAAALRAPAVVFRVAEGAAARDVVVRPRPGRPLGSFPAAFWAQLAFGVVGALMGAWVWALRPADWGARAYAASGAAMLLFTHAAAVYSSRELALPAVPFEALSAANHLGAFLFGAALCSLFLAFPRPIAGPWAHAAVAGAALAWWVVAVLQLAPDQDWGTRLPVILEMAGAIVLALVQWRRASGDPAARALLRWSALWMLGGPGLFVALVAVVTAAGWLPPIPQGYAFGFFVLMYAGLAVGLRRHRPFALDEWALRILVGGAAAVGFVAFDAWLLARVGEGGAAGSAPRTIALGVLLLLVYVPVRRRLWERVVRPEGLRPEALFEQVLAVSYAESVDDRSQRWRQLLGRAFEPLHVAAIPPAEAPAAVTLLDDGAALALPAVAGTDALRVLHPWRGRRLFAPRHVRLAETLVRLMRAADESRGAFERGVLGERARIARDIHDAVSSPLLVGIARGDGSVRDEVREAMRQLRTIVSGGELQPAPLGDCLADARYEAVERLRAHGLAVDWPVAADADHAAEDAADDPGPRGAADDARDLVLSPAAGHALASFHREVATNILKHAGATRVVARVTCDARGLVVEIADDGVGIDTARRHDGAGLANLRARAATLGGRVVVERADGGRGTAVRLFVPRHALAAGGASEVA